MSSLAPSSTLALGSGFIFDFGGTTAPSGFLECDGSAVSRADYSNLFDVIGTTWGAGDGSTTFNVPNFERKTLVGAGGTGTGTLGNAVGDTGGEETHTLSAGEMPNHTHTQNVASVGGGSISPTGAAGSTPVSGNMNTGSSGSGNAHNNMQPSAITMKVIKI